MPITKPLKRLSSPLMVKVNNIESNNIIESSKEPSKENPIIAGWKDRGSHADEEGLTNIPEKTA